MMNKKNMGILGIIALAIIAGFLIYRDTRGSKIEITGETADGVKNMGISMTGDGKVEVIPFEDKKLPPMPSLTREFAPSVSINPDLLKAVQGKMAVTIANLEKNSNDKDSWIALGGERKVLGDYEGARDAWEYAKALEPGDVTAWSNLADLYHFYLKDFAKSEKNWKQAIVLKPDYAQGYRGLYELYTYSMPEKSTEIPAILSQGIAKIPEATDLKVLLENYEKTLVK